MTLAVRVHSPMLAWWTAAVAVLGLAFGAISPSFDAFDSGGVREMLERLGGAGAFRDILLAAVSSMAALVVTCFGVAVIAHGGSDEQDGRTEEVLATATSRTAVLGATSVVAFFGATWLLLVTGVGLALGVGGDSSHSFATLVVTVLAQAPAVWVVVALVLLLLAVQSRWAVLGWGLVVLFGTLGQIGELLRLPDWVLQLSPYSHVPKMPAEPFDWGSALALAVVGVVIVVLALMRYRTRDIG